MIPYFEIPPWKIGDTVILEVFGVCVFLAVILGYEMSLRHAERTGLSRRTAGSLLMWTLGVGFVVSHWVAIFFYYPERLKDDPYVLLKVWASLSSFGGFLGGVIGALGYIRYRKLPAWEYVDAILVGLTVGWFFGRLGCTLVHDHPGIKSDFFLAVSYPGGARHDLGFYEWLFTIPLNVMVFWLRRKKSFAGTITAAVCLAYAPVRFGLDFLRASDVQGADPRYLGLTAGQYAAIVLLLGGFAILWNTRQRKLRKAAEPVAPPPAAPAAT